MAKIQKRERKKEKGKGKERKKKKKKERERRRKKKRREKERERTGLPLDMPKMDVIKDWISKNQHLNSDVQCNEKYPDGIFCAYPTGVALGRELPDGNSEMKTFVTYEMLRGKQIEKGESQIKAAIAQEEMSHQKRNEIVEQLAKYRKAGLIG